MILSNEFNNLFVYVFCLISYLIIKVRTVERTLKLCCIDNTEIFLYITSHLVSSSSSKGNNGSIAYLVDDWSYSSVFRTEIMSPFRDAMSLINGIKRYLYSLEKVNIFFFCQRLRCHIQQFCLPIYDVTLHLVNGRFIQRGV